MAPFVFSDSVVGKVKSLIEEEGNPDLKLRVFVQSGAVAQVFNTDSLDEIVNEDDTKIEKDGVTLLVDSMSYQYLVGAEIDYKEDIEGAQFVVFVTQMQICGCGSSFSV